MHPHLTVLPAARTWSGNRIKAAKHGTERQGDFSSNRVGEVSKGFFSCREVFFLAGFIKKACGEGVGVPGEFMTKGPPL